MVHELEELPLLPLNTVLFPYAQLQMHVSEERHRQMVRACVEYDRPFGIVLIRPGSDQVQSEPYLVGTAVRIMAVHTYEDGQMDVQVQGERRFRVRELDESRPYLVARVEPLIELEIDETPESEALFFKAREDCQLLVQRRFEQQGFSVRVEFPPDPVALSFTIANLLAIENLEKQRLLETTDTLERLQSLIPIIETQMLENPRPSYARLTGTDLTSWIHPN